MEITRLDGTDEVEIILVEDNPADAKLVLLAFKKINLGKNVLWLKDGEEILDYLFGEGNYKNRNLLKQPKLILLDLSLPKIDGLEVLKRIKNSVSTAAISVVILTGSQAEEDIVKSYESGGNNYIGKAIANKNLLKVIGEDSKGFSIDEIFTKN